jgi:O-antigen/teichoic acid export membrane protein
VDVVMLKLLGRSAGEVGVYGAAQSLTLATSLFTASFAPLLLSTVTRAVTSGDLSHAREIARDAVRLVVLLAPPAAILAASAPEIVALVFGPQYLSGIRVFQCLILAGLMSAAIAVGSSLLVAAGKPRWTLGVAAPLPVIAIVAHVWVIPRFGPVGAAWVTMCCAGLGAALTLAAVRLSWTIAPSPMSVLTSAALAVVGGTVAAAWTTPGPLVVAKLATLCAGVLIFLAASGEFGDPKGLATRARRALHRSSHERVP